MFKPQRLGTVTIPDAELTTDKKNCKKIGPCGVGEKAIYLNSFYFDRRLLHTNFFHRKNLLKELL